MINEKQTIKGTTELVRLMDELTALHEQLLGAVCAKTEAMRRADMPAMRESGRQEQLLVERINERTGLRRQLMDMIGDQLGLPRKTARVITASQLAARLPESHRAALMAAAVRLKEAVAPVARANRMGSAIATRVVGHLKQVFASVTGAEGSAPAYSRTGGVAQRRDAMLFEALG